MKILDSLRFGPLSPEKLEEFEQRHAIKIPAEYREFLLTHNGGAPEPDTINFPDGSNTSALKQIYGIHNGPYWANLEDAIDCYQGRMPEEFIPFGDDPMGNAFIICTSGENEGKVYFWDHENEYGEQPHYDNITFLADSFYKLLENLQEWVDPNETAEERMIRINDIEGFRKLIDDENFDIEKTDRFDRTLLENLTIYPRPEMIKLLLEKGADCTRAILIAEDNLELFPQSGYQEIIDLFVKQLQKY